ncbi:hypothetical protein [Chitinimonas lacunae]|uniref:Uncharacterized protein n=1 Tax=Chitinimonas lacunae TaxID=1963018 RepID=A0ABV8MPD3_9NEIS
MLNARVYALSTGLAIILAGAVEKYGYTVAYSGFLLALLVVIAPGVFVGYFGLVSSAEAALVLSMVINVLYYCLIASLIKFARVKAGSKIH